MTSHYTRGYVAALHGFGGVFKQPLDNFLLGSHNFMVMALGSCVKWPLVCAPRDTPSHMKIHKGEIVSTLSTLRAFDLFQYFAKTQVHVIFESYLSPPWMNKSRGERNFSTRLWSNVQI
jgi:hypothetical protein